MLERPRVSYRVKYRFHAGRLRKNRGQTAHFARPFSENQRLTLRNGCQTHKCPVERRTFVAKGLQNRRLALISGVIDFSQ